MATHYPKEIIAKAKAMYVLGGRSKDIAQALGINDVSIRQWIARHGWVRDKVEAVARATTVLDKTANVLALRAIADHQFLIKGTVDGLIGKIARSQAQKPLDILNLANALDKVDSTARRNLGLNDEAKEQRANHQSINLFLGNEEPERVIDVTPES